MNHQERMELLAALSRAGVHHYKSHDLEIKFGEPPKPQGLAAGLPDKDVAPPAPEDPEDAEKLKNLINTLKMDDASLADHLFPAGAGL